jgi:hypothetical protein
MSRHPAEGNEKDFSELGVLIVLPVKALQVDPGRQEPTVTISDP